MNAPDHGSATDAADHLAAGGGIESVLTASLMGGFGALFPLSAYRRAAASVAKAPSPVTDAAARLSRDLASIALTGKADGVGPDGRFTDPAWQQNPLFHRIASAYLAVCATTDATIDALDIDWRSREQLRQSTDNLLSAVAPTNNPALNPQVWKAVLDTGGANLVRGARNFVDDMQTPVKLPASVDRSAYVLGESIAATKGSVIRRERMYELIEYVPMTEEVDSVPSVLIASPVNKFYLLDLDPARSVVRGELRAGRRVFVVSWVNPDRSHADAGFTAYATAIIETLETAASISGSTSCHVLGLCGGGQLTLVAAAYLAALGRQHLLQTLSIAIAVTEFSEGPAGSANLDRSRVHRAIDQARKRGSFSAAATARSFALMRPVDGVWHGFVDRYLLGRPAPKHDLLFWAADQTNLSAQFGAEMMTMGIENSLAAPGAFSVDDVPLDVSAIDVPTYILGASTDHISPWVDTYRTVRQIGENASFVLATGGHAAAIAKGPGSKRASHRTGGPAYGVPAAEWLAGSELQAGPWWDHWNAWIAAHTPSTAPAPSEPGSPAFPPIDDAPGRYVRTVLI